LERQNDYRTRNLIDSETQRFLKGILEPERCVPFLGAGFTAGERSRSGHVPSGTAWLKLMRSQVSDADSPEKPTATELAGYSFQELSDIYFREEIVPLSQIKDTINAHFTNVRISDRAKLDFLQLDWPYIYTLNIDDALENSIGAVKVLPYRAFARYQNRRYVYKLHGDAEDVLSAPSRDALNVIFGKGDYIKSLTHNHALLSDLTNDFAEKNLLFIGCSLADEIDISFALAGLTPNGGPAQTARIYVTSSEPSDYSTKKKLRSYGITDVVVGDYSLFYALAKSLSGTRNPKRSLLQQFAYSTLPVPHTEVAVVRFMVQVGWKAEENPYLVSVERSAEPKIRRLLEGPMTILSGRRFAGKTTTIHRLLQQLRGRQRYFIGSSTLISDDLLNEILTINNSLVAIDAGALNSDQLSEIARKTDGLRANNTSVLVARNNSDYIMSDVGAPEMKIELPNIFNSEESRKVDLLVGPLGFRRWNARAKILDNLFTMADSPIVKATIKSESTLRAKVDSLCQLGTNPDTVSLDFAVLYYLAVKSRMSSRVHRTVAQAWNLNFATDTLLDSFSRKWEPFIELGVADAATRRVANSSRQLISNSHAWVHFSVRKISTQLGIEKTSDYIASLYKTVREVDDRAHELILFDKLNAIYEPDSRKDSDWRARIIRVVYDNLRDVLLDDPNYWLQRAKSIYYLSTDEDELRLAIAYCEKGIIERSARTSVNATLTRANLLGKLCEVTDYREEEDVIRAILCYSKAIGQEADNPAYVAELLEKSRDGKGYMAGVYDVAESKASMLQYRKELQAVGAYAKRKK